MGFASLLRGLIDAPREIACALPGRGGEGVQVKLLCGNAQERGRAKTYATKEPEMLLWLRKCTEPGEVLWDVGANVGLYSLYAARLGLEVVAFEPHIPNCARLLQNIDLNGLAKEIQALPVCVSEGERFGGFFVSSLKPGTSIHRFSEYRTRISSVRLCDTTFLMECGYGIFSTTSDRLVREWGFMEPHHIKIDTDGHEWHVLDGMKGLLGAAMANQRGFESFPYAGRLKSVLMEVHDDEMGRARAFFRAYGFEEDADYPETSREREKRRAREEGGRWAGTGNMVFRRL